MDPFPYIDDKFISNNTSFTTLTDILKKAFAQNEMIVPLRHHHDFPNPGFEKDSSMLLMPAWTPGKSAGVKIVAVSPHNSEKKLPTIQGTYLYFDSQTGTIKAILEAKSLTNKRTAAASALASVFLSRNDAATLLMIGTGSLAPDLIRAHCSVRPIKKVWIFGRTIEKALAIANKLEAEGFDIAVAEDLQQAVTKADIISCATLSEKPLFPGKWLKPGQHLDLVGSYKPNMREADDDAVLKSSIFLDNYKGGLKETGDIVIPVKQGILDPKSIKADLFELCAGSSNGRQSRGEITLFKSVGHALEDLAAADYYYQEYQKQNA